MRDDKLLYRTCKATEDSDFHNNNGKRVRVAAAIYEGGTLLAESVNQSKSHPMQKHYNQYIDYYRGYRLHAEINAIIHALKKKQDLSSATIYIARKLNCCGYGLARPCPACMEAIKDAGISKIVYTTEDGHAVEYID